MGPGHPAGDSGIDRVLRRVGCGGARALPVAGRAPGIAWQAFGPRELVIRLVSRHRQVPDDARSAPLSHSPRARSPAAPHRVQVARAALALGLESSRRLAVSVLSAY